MNSYRQCLYMLDNDQSEYITNDLSRMLIFRKVVLLLQMAQFNKHLAKFLETIEGTSEMLLTSVIIKQNWRQQSICKQVENN